MKKNSIIAICAGIVIVVGGFIALEKAHIFNFGVNVKVGNHSISTGNINNNISIDSYNIMLSQYSLNSSEGKITLNVKNTGQTSINAINKNNIEIKLGNIIIPSNNITIDNSSTNNEYTANEESTLNIKFNTPQGYNPKNNNEQVSLIFNINGKTATINV